MSGTLTSAAEALNAKLEGGFDGTVKFVIEDEGSILVDGDGARVADGEADATVAADLETFQDIMSGDLDPTSAFMQGKMKIDGDMGAAMRLGSHLA